MLDEVLKRHMRNNILEEIKSKQPAEAKAIIAGEIYIRQRHLAEAQHQKERLDDEIAELEKFDVEAEKEKSVT